MERLNIAPSSLPIFIQPIDIKWTLCTPFYALSPSKIEKCYTDIPNKSENDTQQLSIF